MFADIVPAPPALERALNHPDTSSGTTMSDLKKIYAVYAPYR